MESDKENKKFVVSVTKSGEKFVPAYDSGLSKPEGCLSRKKKKRSCHKGYKVYDPSLFL